MKVRQQGTVTKYIEDRGYGFLTPTNGDADIFFHFRQWRSDAAISLGCDVEYTVVEDRKQAGRYRATDVELIAAAQGEK